MPEFVWLRQGDTLPAVAAAQALLNRTGAGLSVDGIFGPRTAAAVRAFQRPRRLVEDGIIGSNTWPRLSAGTRLPIVDCIDVFDPDLYTSERRLLVAAGGQPNTLGGMSNGIEQVVHDILARGREVFLVRFHGHGAPGIAGASDGHGELTGGVPTNSSFETNDATRQTLRRLRGCFGPYGSIQFMHCSTGSGPAGERFLRLVAQETGVPAVGAYHLQYASTLRETLRYEGPARTVCPDGASMRTWAMSKPPFPGFTPA